MSRDLPTAGNWRWYHPVLGPIYAAAEILVDAGYWHRAEDLLEAAEAVEEYL